MRYVELSLLSKKIIDQAGSFCDPVKVDLENMIIDYDSENQFLTAALDYLEIILQDPQQYIEDSELTEDIKTGVFINEISLLHAAVLQTLSKPLTTRNTLDNNFE